jgi:hypothetical protein
MNASTPLKIAGIVLIVIIFIFVAVGPTALQFRALLELVFNFVVAIAWPVAAVLIVLILRKPLSDLVGRDAGQARCATSAPSQRTSETESKPD